MAHQKNVSEWDSKEVASWLCSINLSQLIPTFERNEISGNILFFINDAFMKETLRMSKPAEIAALKGALASLNQQDAGRKSHKTLPKPSLSSVNALPTRNRAGSAGAEAKPPTSPKTAMMTTRRTLDTGVKEPQLLIAPARQLLDDHCTHSGWIRKQGGGHRNWKKRYLILRLGCLYYYSNETAATPKGQFTLSGYKTKLCDESTIIERYPWTLEIIPSNPAMRVYYVSAGAKKELENWKAAIDSEIDFYKKSTPTLPPNVGNPIQRSEDRLSPPASGGGDGASSEEEDGSRIYDEPPDSEDNEENGKGIYVDLINRNEVDDGEIVGDILMHSASQSGTSFSLPRSQTTSEGKPRIPERPLQSVSSSLSTRSTFMSGDEDNNIDVYLDLQGINNTPAVSPAVKVDKKVSLTVASFPNNKTLVRDNVQTPVRDNKDSESSKADYEDDGNFGPRYETDSENPYYILFSSPEEIMPECCIFNTLERDEVDRLLRSKNYNGTYLIREGNHAGTEKVLSVWHNDKCRHYKLFKDEHGLYSLTQGTPFKTIPALLQHYQKQSHLPKSDFYLSVPYKPDQ